MFEGHVPFDSGMAPLLIAARMAGHPLAAMETLNRIFAVTNIELLLHQGVMGQSNNGRPPPHDNRDGRWLFFQ